MQCLAWAEGCSLAKAQMYSVYEWQNSVLQDQLKTLSGPF